MKEYNQLLHQLLASQIKHQLPICQPLSKAAAVVFVLEKGETYFEHTKIVYVGHSNNIAKRSRQLFYGQSHLRQLVQHALRKSEQSMPYESYIEQYFELVCIYTPTEDYAKKMAQQVILTLQKDQFFQPTMNWIGNKVHEPMLSQTKLWQAFAPQSLELDIDAMMDFLELVMNQPHIHTSLLDWSNEILQQHSNQFPVRKILRLRTEWIRNPYVKAYTLKRAAGYCELCNQNAPFQLADGQPYLEVHHIIPLQEDGPDIIENCVALCPNCHRKIHYGAEEIDTEHLKNKQK